MRINAYTAIQEYEVFLKDNSQWYGLETKINDKFIINKNDLQKTAGYYTQEGYQRYLARSQDKEGYFHELRGCSGDMKLSRFSACTSMGYDSSRDDFYQYNAAKLAVLSGGINHLETNHFHRS